MNRPLLQLYISQLKVFFREPGILFWAFGFPIMMAFILGTAFDTKKNLLGKIAYIGTEDKLGELKILQKNKNFEILSMTEEEAKLSLKRGKILLYVKSEPTNTYRYYFDPGNSESYLAYLKLQNRSGEANIIPLTSKGERYIDFFIPGLITMGIMNSCLWGIGWNLIEFRMKKLLRRIIASPVRKSDFLLSHFLNRLTITFAENVVLLLFAGFYFKVQMPLSWGSFFLLFLAGNFCFAGFGVLISSRTANTQIANGLINAVGFPMMILSGIFFSYHNFPDWIIPVIQYLPLTVFTDALRMVFVEGAGLVVIIIPTVLLFLYGLFTFLLGLRIYRWD
ncbi:MAG: ABC transporter permease [Leptospiraceae bacterium]|nr:ABC transporter permease [Leptospiraceae bacterium]MCP5498640.1 ABC transporter permease [Leptospiraceae bacterium]